MSLSKQNPKPKYCKVCHDSGKDEKTYTSHYVRETPDPSSRVVCPTLLSMECKYCYKKGHTVKFCKVIKNRSRQPNKSPKPLPVEDTKKPVSNNMYSLLESDDEDNNVTILNHTPQIFIPSTPPTTPPPLSYAKIIEVTQQQVAEEEQQRLLRQEEAKEMQAKQKQAEQIKKLPILAPAPIFITRRAQMLNWADDTSSDEEDVVQEQESYMQEEY